MDNINAATNVDSVIMTGDLDRRSSRAPDYKAEAKALTALANAMSSSPDTVLQRLVEMAMELTRADSAGISLLEPGSEKGTFRWVVTAGAWKPYRDGTMPREASPCGEVIARDAVVLMKNPERPFPALLRAEPAINEALLAPFHLDGVPVGTVWVIKHSPDDHFEAEDARALESLSGFASAAQQMVEALRLAEGAGKEAKLRAQQLVALADVSSEFFGTCDMNFMPIYGNAAAMRMVGLADLDEVRRTPLQEFFFPEDLPFITEEFFPRVLRDGQARVEIRFRHFATGEPIWVDYSLVVLKDEMGRPTGLGTITHDLTERKRAESALLASEARFRALATVGSSSVYRMSPDWSAMHNLEGAAFLADTEVATVGWIDRYIPADERPRVRKAINRAIADKDVFELEHRVMLADGTVGWTFSRAIPLFDDAGEISEWFGAATDVTARVKADQSFKRLFQASPAPFLVLKPDAPHFTIAEVNDAYLSATMRTRDEVVGRGIFEAYPDNPHEPATGGVSTLRASLEKVLATRQPDTLPNLQYDVVRPDGTFEKRLWSPVNSAVLDDNGEVEALIHNANDVTEARGAEVALRESEEKYRTLFETMGQGYALVELIRDASGKAIDQRYLAFNSAIERLLKATAADTVGKLASEIFPAIEPLWIETFDRVVREGRSERIEHFFTPLERWFEVYAYPAGGDRFVTLYEDTTERKRSEETLRRSAGRDAFRVELTDALRSANDPIQAQAVAMHLLGEQLGVMRAQYWEVEPDGEHAYSEGGYVKEGPRLSGRVRLNEYGAHVIEALAAGATVAVGDVRDDPLASEEVVAAYDAVGVRAVLTVPLVKGGRIVALLGVSHTDVRDWTRQEIALVEETAERTWAAVERARAELAMSESETRFRQFSEASPNILWIRDAATMRMEFASPAFDTIYGIPGPHCGGNRLLRSWARLVLPEHRKNVLANFRRVREGERVEQEFQFRRASDGALRWIHNTDFPLLDVAGNVRWVAGLGVDITEAKENVDRQHILVAELQHRTRNLMGVIRSMSDKTVRASADLHDYRLRFRTRLDALARVQGLLSRLKDHDRVSFDELIDAELAALDGAAEQVRADGPKGIRLRSSMVQTLAMAIHELATNAVKYGALSQPSGRLTISWNLDLTDPVERRLNIDWRETGVTMPPTLSSALGGQGRELIERALPYQLGAKTSFRLGLDGVNCTISVPAVSMTAGVPTGEHA